MIRNSPSLALPGLGLLLLPCLGLPAYASSHCAVTAGVTPIEGSPGWFLIETAHGSTTARWPAPRPERAAPPNYVIRALDQRWDADGNTESVTDTLVVTVGSTVRWQLVAGIHTFTNGKGSGDPEAGSRFDYLLDEQHPAFDSTFTVPDTVQYFCFFHEPLMRGVLIVSSSASVPGDDLPARLSFTQPPRPNPSRGTVSFSIGLPREQKVRVEVLDVNGRRVALLHEGPLAAGNHPFRWRGWNDRGELARTGLYVIHLNSADVFATRPVSLLR